MSDSMLPDGWRFRSLGEVLEEVDIRARNYAGGIGLPVLSLTKNHGLILQSERFNHRVATEDVSDYKVVERESIVYNPYVLWEGAVHALWHQVAGLVSPVYPVWRAVEADPYFLDCLLKTAHLMEAYERVCSGVVKRRRSISKTTFQNLTALVPPISEQRVIVQALRAVQEARDAHRRELDAERERKSALTTHLFTFGGGCEPDDTRETEFGRVPARWPTMLLSECAYVQTGAAKGRKFVDSIELPYLRVANVQDGYLDLSEIKTISIGRSEKERYRLRAGDVVLTEGGDFDKLGRGSVWRGEVPDCVHQNHIFAVRVNRECLLPDFFAYLSGNAYGKAYFLSVAHKTTNLACINTTKLKAFPVLVPPLEEQERIVAALSACDRKIAALTMEAVLHDELFRAMLEDLMTGRLSALPLADSNEGNDEATE